MGVIKKHESLFEKKYSISEETLYIPSSDEEDTNLCQNIVNNQLQTRNKSTRQQPPTIGPIFFHLKKGSGKKKFRRYHDAIQLITMSEEDELQEVTIEDFMVSSNYDFSVLLNDDQFLQPWNEFILTSEEKQKVLLPSRGNKVPEGIKPYVKKTLKNLKKKKSLPLGILRYLEEELISFFSAYPKKTYISPVLSSFERFLLHLVSDHHNLVSLSFLSESQNVKLVRVKNPKNEFSLQPLLLVQYVELNYGRNYK